MIHPDFGLLNLGIRAMTGVKVNFLGDPHFAMPTIAMIEVWKGLGFWAILFFSGCSRCRSDLYHAAELDGAGPIRRFFSLTLPLMKPTFYFAVIFATIVNLQLFDSVFVLTDGGPVNSTATIAWYIYRSLFTFSDPGFGATLSFVLVIDRPRADGLADLAHAGARLMAALARGRRSSPRPRRERSPPFVLAVTVVMSLAPFFYVVSTSLQGDEVALQLSPALDPGSRLSRQLRRAVPKASVRLVARQHARDLGDRHRTEARHRRHGGLCARQARLHRQARDRDARCSSRSRCRSRRS